MLRYYLLFYHRVVFIDNHSVVNILVTFIVVEAEAEAAMAGMKRVALVTSVMAVAVATD